MTRDDATRIVRAFLHETYPRGSGGPDVVIAESATVETPYGWLFMYDTAKALETGDPGDGLIGNGPLLVRRDDGEIIEFSSFYTRESALAAYEADPARFPPVRG